MKETNEGNKKRFKREELATNIGIWVVFKEETEYQLINN